MHVTPFKKILALLCLARKKDKESTNILVSDLTVPHILHMCEGEENGVSRFFLAERTVLIKSPQ